MIPAAMERTITRLVVSVCCICVAIAVPLLSGVVLLRRRIDDVSDGLSTPDSG
jgi:hypothetical protein